MHAIETPVTDATEKALEAADHLTDMDVAAVEAMRTLARRIDAWDVIARWAIEDAEGIGRPAVPQNDNVSLGSFLKYADALGLTPLVRDAVPRRRPDEGRKAPGKLAAVAGTVPRPA